MHQSGHSRAHSMQTVQFSSSSAITPRLRGGRSGSTSGYCWVVDRLVIVLNVTASPLSRPLPGALRSPSSLTRAYPAPSPDERRAHPQEIFSGCLDPAPVAGGLLGVFVTREEKTMTSSFVRPGVMTDPGKYASLFDGLPKDAAGVGRVVQG